MEAGRQCNRQTCEEETRLRCPFRDMVRSRANNRIRQVASMGQVDIWDKHKAEEACLAWYGREIANLTRIAAVWDVLGMLPCHYDEDSAREDSQRKGSNGEDQSCFSLETDGVGATHPLAKWCYRSKPVDLNIGFELSVQCCYGEDLQLLKLGHKGAGSVDYVSAESSAGEFMVAQLRSDALCDDSHSIFLPG